MKKVMVFAGHGLRSIGTSDPGAVNQEYGITEYEMARSIVSAMTKAWSLSPHEGVALILDPGPSSLSHKIDMVNKEMPFFAVDIHLNAAPPYPHEVAVHPNRPRGTEVLCFGLGGKSARIAAVFQKHLLSSIAEAGVQAVDRKIKPRKDLGFLHYTRPATIITEADFISHPDIAKALRDGDLVEYIAHGHIEAILEAVKD